MARYRFISSLPMPGQKTAVFVSTYFHPFALPKNMNAMPRGGKAAKWWWVSRFWESQVAWEGTLRTWESGAEVVTPLSGDFTFNLGPSDLGAGPPLFVGDERDRKNPIFCRWGGSADSALPLGPYVTVGFDLMQPTPIASGDLLDWIGYPDGFAGPSYYEIAELFIAPLFILRLTLGHHGYGQTFKVTSYPRNANDAGLRSPDDPGGSKQMANGAMDGESFLLYGPQDDPFSGSAENPSDIGVTLDSLAVNIVPADDPFAFWGWDGMYSTSNGALLLPSTDYDD